MWPNVDDLDGLSRVVYAPPNALAARQVVLIDALEMTSEEFSLAGDWMLWSPLQVRVRCGLSTTEELLLSTLELKEAVPLQHPSFERLT